MQMANGSSRKQQIGRAKTELTMATSTVQSRDRWIYSLFSKAYVTNGSTKATNIHRNSSRLETKKGICWCPESGYHILELEFHLDKGHHSI